MSVGISCLWLGNYMSLGISTSVTWGPHVRGCLPTRLNVSRYKTVGAWCIVSPQAFKILSIFLHIGLAFWWVLTLEVKFWLNREPWVKVLVRARTSQCLPLGVAGNWSLTHANLTVVETASGIHWERCFRILSYLLGLFQDYRLASSNPGGFFQNSFRRWSRACP